MSPPPPARCCRPSFSTFNRMASSLARAWLWIAGAAIAGAALVGCQDKGQYHLSWSFSDQPPGIPFTALECGLHAVDSFFVSGTSEGHSDSFVTPCGPGGVTREVPTGTW